MKITGRLLSCLVAVTAILASPSPLRAQTASTCVYESKSYSEGASICVHPSLMLNCSASDARLVWKIVTDQDIARMCAPQTASRYKPRRPRARLKSVVLATPPVDGAAKCFQFKGRKYCE